MLDYLFAELAVNQLENTVVPARRYKSVWKHKAIQGTMPKTGIQWVSWLFFGADKPLLDASGSFFSAAKPGVRYERNMYLHTVSDWIPHQVIRSIGARDGIQPYSLKQSVANFACMEQAHINGIGKLGPTKNPGCNPRHEAREIYVTGDYLLGASHVTDIFYDISEIDADHFGAIWRTDKQHNSIRVAHPHFFWSYSLESGHTWGDEDWGGFSPFRFAGLNKNVYIALYDLTLQDPYISAELGSKPQHAYRNTEVHQAVYVYIPDNMALVKATEDGRFYYRDDDVYALVRPLVPEAAASKTSIHNGYSRLELSGSVTGTYLIMGSKREHGSLSGFVDYTARATFDTTKLVSQKKVTYVHPDGTLLSVASPGAVSYTHLTLPTILLV